MAMETGALLFVSFVSAPTLMQGVRQKDASFLRTLFPIWWPKGSHIMVPLGSLAVLSNLGAIYSLGITSTTAVPHMVAAGSIIGVIGFTSVVMMGDIQALCSPAQLSDAQVFRRTEKFCNAHRVRSVVAVLGLSVLCVSQMM
jgi:hypothetical protein